MVISREKPELIDPDNSNHNKSNGKTLEMAARGDGIHVPRPRTANWFAPTGAEMLLPPRRERRQNVS
jgi:hypothetical protein